MLAMSGLSQAVAAQKMVVELSEADMAQVSRIADDLCARDVILLGEDGHHGSGRTMQVKAALVQALVERCGFDELLFESSFDEFVGFNQALAAGRATRQQLADAVGGIWSDFAQMQPMLDWAFDAARSRKLEVSGIDPQSASASGYWTQAVLGNTLAGFVPPRQREACKASIDRNARWTYDDAHPLDDAEQARLDACTERIRKTLAQRSNRDDEVTEMGRAWSRFALQQAQQDPVQQTNIRDEGMYQLLSWHRRRGHHKTIVWCATVHAAKTLLGRRIPTGVYVHRELGDRMASVGFSALEGEYGRQPGKDTKTLVNAEPDSLEAHAAAQSSDDLWFLDRAALQLAGPRPARALDYEAFERRDWSQALDGLVVLRREAPVMPLTAP